MIAQVARLEGRTVELTGGQSYALSLWTFIQEDERKRLDAIMEERQAIDAAYMVAVAFHEPKRLRVFETEWRAKLTRHSPAPLTREQLSQRADDLWAQHSAASRKLPVS